MKDITSPDLAWLQITNNILDSFSETFVRYLQIFYTANTLSSFSLCLYKLQVDLEIKKELMTAVFSL